MYFGFPLTIGFTLCCQTHIRGNIMSLPVLDFTKKEHGFSAFKSIIEIKKHNQESSSGIVVSYIYMQIEPVLCIWKITFQSDMLKSKSFGPLPCFDIVVFYIVAKLSSKKTCYFFKLIFSIGNIESFPPCASIKIFIPLNIFSIKF